MTTEELAAKEAADAAKARSIANFSAAGGKSPEELEAQRVADAAALAAKAIEGKTPEEIAAAKAAAEGGTKFTPNTYWGSLKEHYGVELPEVLAGETLPDDVDENKLIYQAIQNQVLGSLPPQVRELYTYMNNNESVEEFYKAKVGESGFLNLPDEQFANEYLRKAHGKSEANPNGLSDEVIAEKVQKLVDNDTLDLMVLDWKASAKKEINESKSDVNVQAAKDAQFTKVYDSAKGNVQTFYDKSLKEVNEINGLEVTPEQRDSFKPLFEKIVMPDKTLGTSPLMMMIQDNGVLFNMLYGLFNSKEAINNVLSNTKEEAKMALLKTLDIEPITTREKSPATDLSVKLSKFSSPETR
ncbi:MAG: hypothetical protein DRP97_00980 [Candidatus Latescibacterota bacterium]|nr:MAG: hypothetical protein DRP97_00980 [Candidatus Latescibacterota bacterium]